VSVSHHGEGRKVYTYYVIDWFNEVLKSIKNHSIISIHIGIVASPPTYSRQVKRSVSSYAHLPLLETSFRFVFVLLSLP
jgi:hypothetical protein